MEHKLDSTWDLGYCQKTACVLVDSDSDEEGSLASEGSRIILTDVPVLLETPVRATTVTPVMPASPLVLTSNPSFTDKALEETPPEKRRVRRKPPDDCHVIVQWSQLSNLIQQSMVCSGCRNSISKLERQTIGIATEIDFSCKCRETVTAYADKTKYMVDKSAHDFIRHERRVDS
jgi:hypothetical protein